MAASGYTPIILLNSTTTGNTPTTSNLAVGELAINVTDGKLFFNQSGTIKVLANATYATSVSTISFGTTGLTPSTATNGVVTVAGTLNTTSGGTGLTSFTAGDLSYYASGTALTKLAIGTNGYILQSTGSAPSWVAASTVVGGAAGSTGQVQFNNAGALGANANLFWDNTNGRLGVGTATPGAPLELQLFSTTNPSLRLRYSSTAYYGEHLMDPSGNYVVRSPAANGVTSGYLSLQAGASMLFSVNGNTYTSPAMAIDTTGQLNLYASSSRIVGGGSNAGRVILSNFDSTTYMIAYGSSYGSGQSSILTFVTSGTNIMTMSATGQFMVGGGPNNGQTYKLGVYTGSSDVQLLINSDNGYNAYINFAGFGGGISYGRDGGTGYFRWSNAVNFGGTQIMTLTNGGQLQVSTTQFTSDAYSNTVNPGVVSGNSIAYTPIDNNGSASLVSKIFNTVINNTYTVRVYPSDSTYAVLDIRVGGYQSSGSGSGSAFFCYGGHVGAYQLNTVFNSYTGNVTISAPSVAGSYVQFTVTIANTGQSGVFVVKVSDTGATAGKTAFITVT